MCYFRYHGKEFAPLHSCDFLIPLYTFGFQAMKLIWQLLLLLIQSQLNGSIENLIKSFWNGNDLWYINKCNIEPASDLGCFIC